MSNKLIVVVVDGMKNDLASENLGYLEQLVNSQEAMRAVVQSELPSLSRPLYEVLLTGTPSHINGITSNDSVRLSSQESLFHLTKKNGLVNATASYYWISELYNRAPFHYVEDREQKNEEHVIQYGKFYWEDHYPDSHLLIDGEVLRRETNPDFLYIHSMNVDDTGHAYGSDSREYREKILKMDSQLSELIPNWKKDGYQIVVTADHGMSKWGTHGGTTDDERFVPLYVISDKVKASRYDDVISQLMFAPFMCRLMGISPSPNMQELSAYVEGWLQNS